MLLEKAQAHEPAATALLRRLVEAGGGRLYGLEVGATRPPPRGVATRHS